MTCLMWLINNRTVIGTETSKSSMKKMQLILGVWVALSQQIWWPPRGFTLCNGDIQTTLFCGHVNKMVLIMLLWLTTEQIPLHSICLLHFAIYQKLLFVVRAQKNRKKVSHSQQNTRNIWASGRLKKRITSMLNLMWGSVGKCGATGQDVMHNPAVDKTHVFSPTKFSGWWLVGKLPSKTEGCGSVATLLRRLSSRNERSSRLIRGLCFQSRLHVLQWKRRSGCLSCVFQQEVFFFFFFLNFCGV